MNTQATSSAGTAAPAAARVLSRRDRLLILATAFLGWLFAGTIMVIIPLAGRAANIGMGLTDEGEVGRWLSYYVASFLLGAATGGFIFGWVGDRIGRAKAMGLSILCYALVTGLIYFVAQPWQMAALLFIASLGLGGMWPSGVSLASEAWPDVSRPTLAGLIGTAANLGFVFLSVLSTIKPVTDTDWRWVMLVGASTAILGVFVLLFVPESPRWLAGQAAKAIGGATTKQPAGSPALLVFRGAMLSRTLIGIALSTIAFFGNWGGANWLVFWAGKVGGKADPTLQAHAQIWKSGGAAVGALLGGWLASFLGRRTTYFLLSLLSLACSMYLFHNLKPTDAAFPYWTAALGFFGTMFFGLLPLYLPELFPTAVRSTGSGVSFNFGRITTAVGVLFTGQIVASFDGDYAKVGQIMCLVYVLGMVVVFAAPDTSKTKLMD